MLSLMNCMSQSESRSHRYIAPGMFDSRVRNRSSLTLRSSRACTRSVMSTRNPFSDRDAARVADEHRLVEDPGVCPVVPLQPVLHAEGLERLASGGELLQNAFTVVGMDQLGEMGELPVGALLRHTQHTLQRRAEMARRTVGADGVHRQGESLEDLRAG
jgi:hypothetical protein